MRRCLYLQEPPPNDFNQDEILYDLLSVLPHKFSFLRAYRGHSRFLIVVPNLPADIERFFMTVRSGHRGIRHATFHSWLES